MFLTMEINIENYEEKTQTNEKELLQSCERGLANLMNYIRI